MQIFPKIHQNGRSTKKNQKPCSCYDRCIEKAQRHRSVSIGFFLEIKSLRKKVLEYRKKTKVRTCKFFQKFTKIVDQHKKCQYSCYRAFVPSLCIPHGRNKVSEKFRRSNILVNFLKNLHVRTLVFIRYFSIFFLKLLSSKKCQYSRYGAFAPSLCIPRGRNNVSNFFLSIDHFGEFLEKFACPDFSFLSIFQHFLPRTFNLQKMPIFTLRGICTFAMRPSRQEQGYWKIS